MPSADLPEPQLREALDRLVASGLLFVRGTPPDAIYIFKHALVQDAAYGTLLRSRRQQLHARIAGALEAHSAELMDSQPELLAQHYAEAGLVEKAVVCWGKAGRRSAARSAMAEAAAQFQKGLDQLALLPNNPERQRQELEFWSALGAVLRPSKDPPRRKPAMPMPAHESCGSSWVLPRSSLRLPMGSPSITRTVANWIWRCAWTRICCV